MSKNIIQEDIDKSYITLKKDAEAYGYYLNPDEPFTKELARGLLVNEDRYGYPACPCRLATGKIKDDRDIICPCDYRDPDLTEYGSCYCGLYVSGDINKGNKKSGSIPERRYKKMEKENKTDSEASIESKQHKDVLKYPVWRCRVCGYLCAREKPPEVCPICKAKNERFERFI